MRAITVSEFGPPSVLTPAEVPIPVPGPGQVLVEVTGAGVGAWDIKMRRGAFGSRDLPYIPGDEISGIVSGAEGDVGFAVGESVFGSPANMFGGYAEYVVVNPVHLASAPPGADLEAAGAAPVGGVTAIEGIDDHLHLQAGQTLLVAGAAGGVGSFIVQVGKARGARVVGTASPDKFDFVRSLGADEVVDYHGDWVEAVRGVDAAFDCVGGDTFDGCVEAVREGGRVVTLVASDRLEQHDPATVSGFSVSITSDRLTELASLISSGSLTVAIGERLPLDDAARAHEIIETGRTHGKIVLIPG
jgi:NADPH:quinone reductase-like Zn-dependent oxidoreductase